MEQLPLISIDTLESHLWESANILRGPVDAADFKTYIFPLLFFKSLSDVYGNGNGIIKAQTSELPAAFEVWSQSRIQARDALAMLLPGIKALSQKPDKLTLSTLAEIQRQFDRSKWTRVRFGDANQPELLRRPSPHSYVVPAAGVDPDIAVKFPFDIHSQI